MTTLILEHIILVATAIAAATFTGIPMGVWAYRHSRWGRLVLTVADIIQTIPGLALLCLLLPLPWIGGIGPRLAILALFLYALMPVLRNTVLGLTQIAPAIREAAVSLGMSPREVLLEIELPLAAPAIIAGLRIATVTTIATATVAAAVGAGGLGVLLYRGLATVDTGLLLEGAIPAALLALLADRLFLWIEGKYSFYQR
jgi:osmoprotectant transport system permease protein